MKRIMVNLDDPIGELVEQKAAEQRRSASSYVALVIEADLRAAGLMSPAKPEAALAEFIAKLQAAVAADPRVLAPVTAALRRSQRRHAAA